MPFYDELIGATARERADFNALPILQRALRGEITLDEYRRFLGQAFHHVRHTVPLLMSCGARLPERLGWLRPAVAEYIEEETGHEEWILDDIAACGGERDAARAAPPTAATELMVAYAHDLVQRRNPAGFFGMVLVLEGTSVALASRAAAAIQAQLGLPITAFRYLTSHGALDQGHIRFFEHLMNRIEDPQDRQDIIHSARMFYCLYGDVFRALDHTQTRDTRKRLCHT